MAPVISVVPYVRALLVFSGKYLSNFNMLTDYLEILLKCLDQSGSLGSYGAWESIRLTNSQMKPVTDWGHTVSSKVFVCFSKYHLLFLIIKVMTILWPWLCCIPNVRYTITWFFGVYGYLINFKTWEHPYSIGARHCLIWLNDIYLFLELLLAERAFNLPEVLSSHS